jgi:hypothetical protein
VGGLHQVNYNWNPHLNSLAGGPRDTHLESPGIGHPHLEGCQQLSESRINYKYLQFLSIEFGFDVMYFEAHGVINICIDPKAIPLSLSKGPGFQTEAIVFVF